MKKGDIKIALSLNLFLIEVDFCSALERVQPEARGQMRKRASVIGDGIIESIIVRNLDKNYHVAASDNLNTCLLLRILHVDLAKKVKCD